MAGRPPPDPVALLREQSRAPATCVTFHSYKNVLLSGNRNGDILVWDLKTRRITTSIKAHAEQSVLSILVLRNEETVVSHGRDGCIHIWDTCRVPWQKIDTIPGTSGTFCPCIDIIRNNEEHLVIPTDTSTLSIVSMSSPASNMVLTPSNLNPGHGMAMGLAKHDVEGETSLVFCGYEDGTLIAFNVHLEKEVSALRAFEETIMALDYHSEINQGVCASVSESILIWNKTDDNQLHSLRTVSLKNPGVSCVKYRPDGKLFTVGCWDSQGRLFGTKKCNLLAVLTCHQETMQCIGFASDYTLALGSKDGAISLWNVYK